MASNVLMKKGITCILIIAMSFFAIYLTHYMQGFVTYVSIEKLTSPPPRYFNLTEEDISKYPIIGEMIEKIEKENRTYFGKEVSSKEGIEIYEYMLERINETEENCGIYFFYKDHYYRFRLGAT